jgi:hypothetical protein
VSDLDEFYINTAQVQAFSGESATGSVYAAAVTVPCFVDSTDQLTVSPTGEQVTSRSTVLYCSLTYSSVFTVGSRVTSDSIGFDHVARVVTVNNLSSGPLGLPDHVEVGLV